MTKAKTLRESIRYASQGIAHALQTQRNMCLLTIAGILLLIAALLYRVPLEEFLLLCVAVSVLWVTEMINTSMEMFVDHASGGAHQTQVKRIKDISAGAVLIAAVNAAIIGSAILCPRVLSTLRSP